MDLKTKNILISDPSCVHGRCFKNNASMCVAGVGLVNSRPIFVWGSPGIGGDSRHKYHFFNNQAPPRTPHRMESVCG